MLLAVRAIPSSWGVSRKRHLPRLTIRGDRARGCCPVHQGDNPQSFSADLSKGVWSCFACGAQGGVVAFARAVGASLPDRNISPLPTSQRVRQSLATAVEAEYHAWKLEQWLDKNEQIRAAEGVITSLEACTRFALSAEEGQRLADLLSHWYAELDALVLEIDRYAPNPKINDARMQEEWIATQEK